MRRRRRRRSAYAAAQPGDMAAWAAAMKIAGRGIGLM